MEHNKLLKEQQHYLVMEQNKLTKKILMEPIKKNTLFSEEPNRSKLNLQLPQRKILQIKNNKKKINHQQTLPQELLLATLTTKKVRLQEQLTRHTTPITQLKKYTMQMEHKHHTQLQVVHSAHMVHMVHMEVIQK
jgi:DNA gyrase/topoisomerase IV subunit A